jgi:beta-N-acetylhexosaminidase
LDNLRHKIGQMLIAGFSGCAIEDAVNIRACLQQDSLGGVLLFDKDLANNSYGKNLKNPAQIKKLTTDLQELAKSNAAKLPLFIALDYEGGAVDRLASVAGFEPTISALEMAALPTAALHAAINQMASTLHHLGFNLNFAPVVDLHLQDSQGIIGRLKRSFSADPNEVVRVASQFVAGFNRYGIACAYKHFPGHGSAEGDTHEGFVDVTDTFQAAELIPYQALLQKKEASCMIMTAHVVNRHLDSTGLPATLSHTILTKLLRETLGFNGIIVSDDLQMQAIANHYPLEEALRLTINAGADMIICANQLGWHEPIEWINCIEQLVKDNKISQQRIDEAYTRIAGLKGQISQITKLAVAG